MEEHLYNNPNKENRFNIYIDLFSKGEFNEMSITKNAGEYQVSLEETYLGTLSCSNENNWEVVNGSIPSFIIPDIARNIKSNN